jgi:hypothetical protein
VSAAGEIDSPGAITAGIGRIDVVLFESRIGHVGGLIFSGRLCLVAMMQYGRCWRGVLGDPGSVLLKRPS